MPLAETEGAGRRLAGPAEDGAQQAADAVTKSQPTGNARIVTHTKLTNLQNVCKNVLVGCAHL